MADDTPVPAIRVTVNGEEMTLPPGTTVSTLLQKLALPTARVAVEHNLRVIPRSEHADLSLNHGDHVEIVTFVGGGIS